LSEKRQGPWFGGMGPGFLLSSPWLRNIRMTAIAIPYTLFGFAAAADGRQKWGNQSSPSFVRESERDNVRKIFPYEFGNASWVYTASGDIASRDRSFDLTTALHDQLAHIQQRMFFSADHFLKTISERLESVIRAAMQEGKIEEYPDSEVTFAGYFRGQPYFANIQFEGREGVLHRRNILNRATPGMCHYTGSDIISSLVSRGDPRFAEFCNPLYPDSSLRDATNHAIGYVRLFASPVAKRIDSYACERIGGHIHAATITPPDRSLATKLRGWLGYPPSSASFQWILPPATGNK